MEDPSESWRRGGPMAWMAKNNVAANLLMFVLLVGGVIGLLRSKQEVFPEVDLDLITVAVPYPGASPAEVEQGIILAVEEAVRGVDGVKRVNATAYEDRAVISIEILLDADPDKVLADVKGGVDRIQTLPEEAERPIVSLAARSSEVISLVISGDQELAVLHDIAERARQELISSGRATKVDLQGVPPLEVAIEIPRESLEAYGLTLPQVAAEVRAASLELPGGGLDTEAGEILVRVADRRDARHEFENLILRSTRDGSKLRLGDIAEIHDGYEDNDQASFFDGHPAVRVVVSRVGDETPTGISAVTREYADQLRGQLPANVGVHIWSDESEILADRIDLLLRNARSGLILVVLILALFLDLRIAFWVAAGIPVSVFGAFLFVGGWDVSINMVTLFAFIVTLGMVVDDAIVVGEHTHALLEEGKSPLEASIRGVREMAMPVTFSVLTTVAAFAPMLFIPGTMGKIFGLIPVVVISILLVSLAESFLILPAHLGHQGGIGTRAWRAANRAFAPIQRPFLVGLDRFSERVYLPVARRLIGQRGLVVAVAVAVLVLSFGWVVSGRLPFNFFPALDGDVAVASARLPYGASIETTKAVQRELERSLAETIDELDAQAVVRGTFTRLGEEPPAGGPGAKVAEVGSHLVAVELSMLPVDQRGFTGEHFAEVWQRNTSALAGVESIRFSAVSGPGAGADIAVRVAHPDSEVLASASDDIDTALRGYADLTNVRNEYAAGKPQLDFHLEQEARSFGLSSTEIATQLRAAFYGAEAIREQRGRNEVKVMVRLPKDQRASEDDLEHLQIRTPAGGHVPLAHVARFDRNRAATAIYREDGLRNVTVTAQLAAGVDSPREVLASLRTELFPALLARHPGLEIDFVGAQREQSEVFAALGVNYAFAVFIIYALLAVPFRSYIQPFIIMSVIPFGFVGMVLGHVAMGYNLSIMSLFGLVALSGVVVNDSIVLIDACNQGRARGLGAVEAVLDACRTRLRPILLTSLTTFFGLAPIMAETSVQARFLIPMAITLGFGILFATLIVLLLVPAIYVIVEDLRARLGGRA